MIKKFVFTLALATALIFSQACYSQAFTQGSINVYIGYGFAAPMGILFSSVKNLQGYDANVLGPIYAKGEYAISDNVGLGLNLAFFRTEASYTPSSGGVLWSESVTYTTYSALARVNYHFGESEKFDPYIGMGLGFRSGKFTTQTTNPFFGVTFDIPRFNLPVGFETTFGSRYLITDNIGLYAEVGIAKSFLQVGVTGKF